MKAPSKLSPRMAASRSRLGERQRQQSRQAIINAAIEVFQEKTPDAAVIGDFVAKAGVARGTFYNYFRDVDELCSAVAIFLSEEFNNAIIASDRDRPDPAERIAIAVRHFIHRSAKDPKWGRLMLHVASHGQLNEIFRQVLALDMEAGKVSGRFLPISSAVGSDLVLGTSRFAMRSQLEGRATKNHAEDVAATILRGLGLDHDDAQEIANRPLPKLRRTTNETQIRSAQQKHPDENA